MELRITLSKTLLIGDIQSYWIFFIFHSLSKIQLISISLFLMTQFVEDFNFSYVELFNHITKGFLFYNNAESFQMSFYSITLIYQILTIFVVIATLCYCYLNLTGRNIVIRMWTLLCYFHNYFGGYTSFAILLGQVVYYSDRTTNFYSFLALRGKGFMITSSILLIWDLFFLGLSLYLITPGIKTKSFFSLKNQILLAVEAVEKILLTTLIFVADDTRYKLLLIYVNFILCGIRAYISLGWMPYWNIVALRHEILFIGPNLLLCGLNLLACWVEDSRTRLYLVLWILLSPITIKICFSLMRKLMLNSLVFSKNSSKWLIVGRKYLISYLTTKKLIKRESHSIENNYNLWSNGLKAEWKESIATLRGEIDIILNEYEQLTVKDRKFKPYLLTYLNLLLKYEPSNLKVYDLIKVTGMKDKDFRIQTAIWYFKDKLREKINIASQSHVNSSNLDTNKYIELRNLMKSLKSEILGQVKLHIKFWAEYSNSDTQFSELMNYSNQIEKKKKRVHAIWRVFENLGIREFQTPAILYTLYLAYVNNRPCQSLKIAKNIRPTKFDGSDKLTNETLYEDNTICIFISGQKSTLGQITDISKSCEQLLGYNKKDVIGINIKNVQPSFFACRHDRKLSNYFSTGKRNILNVLLYLYVVDVEGFIHPAEVIAAQNPFFDNDMNLLGLVKLSTQKKEYLLVKSDGSIDGFTKDIAPFVRSLGSHIYELSRTFKQILKMMNAVGNEKLGLLGAHPENFVKANPVEYHAYFEEGTRINIHSWDRKRYINCRIKVMQFFVDQEFLNIITLDDIIKYNPKMDNDVMNTVVFDQLDGLNEQTDYTNCNISESDFDVINQQLPSNRYDFQGSYLRTLEQYDSNRHLVSDSAREIPLVKINAKKQTRFICNSSTSSNKSQEDLDSSPRKAKIAAKATSTLESTSSVRKSEDTLENVIEYIPPQYHMMFFKYGVVGFVFLILILIIVNGIHMIRSEDIFFALNSIIMQAGERLDNIVLLEIALSQVKLALTGIHAENTTIIYNKYISELEQAIPPLLDSNIKLYQLLGQADNDNIALFFTRVPVVVYEQGLIINSTKEFTSFALIEQAVDISLSIVKNKDELILRRNDEQISYILPNLLNDLLLNCETAGIAVKDEIQEKLESSHTFLKSIVGVSISVIGLSIIGTFTLIKILNYEMSTLVNSFSKITTYDSVSIKKFLEFLSIEIENEGCNGKSFIERKKKILFKEKAHKAKSQSKIIFVSIALKKNFFIVARIWPLMILLLITVIVMYSISVQSLDTFAFYEKQIESSLELNFLSDLAYASTIESVLNNNIIIKGYPPSLIANNLVRYSTDTDYWTKLFIGSGGRTVEQFNYILFKMVCSDPMLALTSDEISYCQFLSGGTNKLGLIQLMTVVSQQTKTFLNTYTSNSMSNSDLLSSLRYIYNNLEITNKFQNNYLDLIQALSLSNLTVETQNTKDLILKLMIAIIVVIIIMLGLVIVTAVRDIMDQGRRIRSLLGLIPLDIIFKTRFLRDYLVRNSGIMGEMIKRINI